MHAPPLGNMLKNSFYECRATLSSYYICSSRENPLGNPARPIKLISNLPLAFFLSFILRVSISYYSQYASQFYSLRSCPRGGNRKKKHHRRNRLKKKKLTQHNFFVEREELFPGSFPLRDSQQPHHQPPSSSSLIPKNSLERFHVRGNEPACKRTARTSAAVL